MKWFPLFFALIFVLVSADSKKTYKIGKYTLKQIEKNIFNESHPYYYDNLLWEFERGDTLTNDQLMHLYFGEATMPTYKPYKVIPFENSITDYSNNNEFSKAANQADSLLLMRPTSLIGCLERSFGLRRMKDTTQAKIYSIRFRQLKSVILSTGDGKTPSTAYWVTSPKDIEPIIQHLGLFTKSFKEKEIDDMFFMEYLYFDKIGKKHKMYFNIDLPKRLGLSFND